MSVSLNILDLQDLLGRENKLFTVPTQIVQNRYLILIQVLGDTGANGFLFIDITLAIKLAKFFNIQIILLGTQCTVKGYNGKNIILIIHTMVLTLNIDGRRQTRLPVLIVSLGQHNMILGRMWFAKYGVMPDYRQQCLVWPNKCSIQDQVYDYTAKIIPQSILLWEEKINCSYQANADSCNKKIQKEKQQEKQGQHIWLLRTFRQDQQDAFSKIERVM